MSLRSAPAFLFLLLLLLARLQADDKGTDTGFELRLVMPENAVGAEPKKMKLISRQPEQTLWCFKRSLMDNSSIKKATPFYDPNRGWHIVVELTEEGAKLFAKITTDYTGRQLGIVANGELITAPYLREPITGGKLEISGNFTENEAKNLAKIFMNGTPSAKPTPNADAQKAPDPSAK
jgi:preprotein translocase subunit SecD